MARRKRATRRTTRRRGRGRGRTAGLGVILPFLPTILDVGAKVVNKLAGKN